MIGFGPVPSVSMSYSPEGSAGRAVCSSLQLRGVQSPLKHPRPAAHALPHDPQCDVFESTFVSQPSATFALQSRKSSVAVGAWQVGVQRLEAQVTPVAFVALEGQRLPHIAQLLMSFVRFDSHPSA